MKEVTEWNGKPRWMWCWDDDKNDKRKDFVLCILNKEQRKELGCVSSPYVVRTYCNSWRYCAEIEEPKKVRMTNRELAWWLRDHPEEHREWKNKVGGSIFSEYLYSDNDENEPCRNILIRSNGGAWREPFKETEE